MDSRENMWGRIEAISMDNSFRSLVKGSWWDKLGQEKAF